MRGLWSAVHPHHLLRGGPGVCHLGQAGSDALLDPGCQGPRELTALVAHHFQQPLGLQVQDRVRAGQG